MKGAKIILALLLSAMFIAGFTTLGWARIDDWASQDQNPHLMAAMNPGGRWQTPAGAAKPADNNKASDSGDHRGGGSASGNSYGGIPQPARPNTNPTIPAGQTLGQYRVTNQDVDFYLASVVTGHDFLGMTYGDSFNDIAKKNLPKGTFVQVVEDTATRVTDTGGMPGFEDVTKVNVVQGDQAGNPSIVASGYIKTGVWQGSGTDEIKPPGSLTILENVNPGNPNASGTMLQFNLWRLNQSQQ